MRFRPALLGVFVALACSLGACGSDKPVAATTPPTSAPKMNTAALDSAPGLVKGTVGAPYDVWMARLADQWGDVPTQSWAVEKRADAQWMARVILSGPHGHSKSAEWEIDLPLDRRPTEAEMRAADDSNGKDIKPLNASARKLSTYPPAAPGTRDVRLSAVVDSVLGGKVSVSAGQLDAVGLVVRKSGRIDESALRAVHLFRDENQTVDGVLPVGTKLTDYDGKPLSRARLSARLLNAGPQAVVIRWTDVPQRRKIRHLLRTSPVLVRLLVDPHAKPATPGVPGTSPAATTPATP